MMRIVIAVVILVTSCFYLGVTAPEIAAILIKATA